MAVRLTSCALFLVWADYTPGIGVDHRLATEQAMRNRLVAVIPTTAESIRSYADEQVAVDRWA